MRLSPFIEYWRAGKVTLRAEAPRRSQIPKPTSLRPSSGPSVKCNSASASFPTGLPFVVRVDLHGHAVCSHLFSSAVIAAPSQLEEPVTRET